MTLNRMSPTTAYAIRRLIFMVPTLVGVSVIVFFLMYTTGDPISLIKFSSPNISSESLEILRAYYGLDKPVPVQYANWLWNFVRFDLGLSITMSRPVNEIIGSIAWETAKLQLTAMAIALAISIPVAVRSAVKQYSKSDYLVTTVAIFGVSMPPFWFGAILIVLFSFHLGWFPSGGAKGLTELWPTILGTSPLMDELVHLVLPAMVIAYVWMALFIRILRANLLEVLREDYVLAARASGLSERRVIYGHALRNATSPLVTFVGVRIGLIFAGAPMTETVFNWPGLGYTFVLAATSLDFPVVMGIIMVITLMVIITTLVVDLAYAYLDPRIRLRR